MPPARSGDGLPDGRFSVTFDVANRLTGDLNADNAVNYLDFNILRANFGKTNRVWSDGDINLDTVVDFADFQRLELLFGSSASTPAPMAPAPALPATRKPLPTPRRRPPRGPQIPIRS
jgi:hypothetical protein